MRIVSQSSCLQEAWLTELESPYTTQQGFCVFRIINASHAGSNELGGKQSLVLATSRLTDCTKEQLCQDDTVTIYSGSLFRKPWAAMYPTQPHDACSAAQGDEDWHSYECESCTCVNMGNAMARTTQRRRNP